MAETIRTLICVFVLVISAGWPVAWAEDEDKDEKEEQDKLPFEVPEDPLMLPPTALVETTKGPFELKLYRRLAPISVTNFEYLGRKGIYNGVEFHRYVPGFVIQGGDPTGTRKGGPGWTLPPEMNDTLRHVRGTVGWARLPAEVNPERRSNGSQFYITLKAAPHIDGFYTIFGQVIRGMENVDRLRPGDKIHTVRFPKKDLMRDIGRKSERGKRLRESGIE